MSFLVSAWTNLERQSNNMIIRSAGLALTAFVLAMVGTAHRIEVDPGEKACFFEVLQPQDRVRP